jgi:hypothetical protein
MDSFKLDRTACKADTHIEASNHASEYKKTILAESSEGHSLSQQCCIQF